MKPSTKRRVDCTSNFESKYLNLLRDHYIEELKKQIHHTKQAYMNVSLTFDMNQILDKDPAFGNWIICNFHRFLKSSPKVISKTIQHIFEKYQKLPPPYLTEDYINFQPNFINFPHFFINFNDYEYKKHILSTKSGRLITLKNAYVLKVHQTDFFLWKQTFFRTCVCGDDAKVVVANPLAHLLRINFSRLKENSKFQKCSECGKLLTEDPKQRVFLPCQRIEIFLPKFSDDKENGIYPLWIASENFTKLKKGDIISGVVYYDIYLEFSTICNRYLATPHDFFLGYQISRVFHFVNQKYFSDMLNKFWQRNRERGYDFLSYEYTNYDYILSGWITIKNCLSIYSNAFIESYDMINLKLALLLSVLLINKPSLKPIVDYQSLKKAQLMTEQGRNSQIIDERINVFVFTDQFEIVSKIIYNLINDLENAYFFPSVYDNNSLMEFLVRLNGGILVIFEPNRLKKSEINLINQLLKGDNVFINESYGSIKINCAIWMLASEPLKERKDWKVETIQDYWQGEADYFDIILDLSRINNIIKGVNLKMDLSYADSLLRDHFGGFCDEMERESIEAAIKKQSVNKSRVEADSNKENLEEIMRNNNVQALTLMKRFYSASRKSKQVSVTDLNSLRKIGAASALLRSLAFGIDKIKLFYSKEFPDLEIIDVVVSILMNEETSMNRKGGENVVFGCNITKFFGQDERDMMAWDKPIGNDRNILGPREKKFLEIYQDILDFVKRFDISRSEIDY